MERIKIAPRANLEERFQEIEFSWHEGYWNEAAYWQLTEEEIDKIELATAEIDAMALIAVQSVIDNYQLPFFGYDEKTAQLIKWSWENRKTQTSLYHRFDLALTPDGPKLLEINGDTPTSLYEAGVVQWDWMEQVFGEDRELDQFNSVHDNLTTVLRALALRERTTVHDDGAVGRILHTTSVTPHPEDEGTCWYLRYLSEEQGLKTKHVAIDQIGWRRYEAGMNDHFVDQDDLPIRLLYKLYPWEWLLKDQFGENLHAQVLSGDVQLIEPAWKMLLSNKRLLQTLWELFPYNQYLLETHEFSGHADRPERLKQYVVKPFLGREGQSVGIFDESGAVEEAPGTYEEDGFIAQEYVKLPRQHGKTAVIGSWVIGGVPSGIGIRESDHLITNNMGSFVPHVFVPKLELEE